MKSITNTVIAFAFLFFTGFTSTAQANTKITLQTKNTTTMKTYLIEREIPNAGNFTPAELKAIARKSCDVLKEMGSQIQWIQSYVTGNKIYCIYKAENEELVRQHAQKSGFPANKILEVPAIISPATAE